MNQDYSRQSFLGSNSVEVLKNCKVAVVGLCGGGSHVVQQLAHIGIGEFVLCDPDHVEASNLNRMVGAHEQDAVESVAKVDVLERELLAVNPGAKVFRVRDAWQTVAREMRDCTAIFGCVDSYSERSQLEAFCRRFLIPYFDVGMDVSKGAVGYVVSGQAIVSMPGFPCMRCMGFIREDLLAAEAQAYGAAGGKPQVVWPNGVLASTIVGLFMQTILPWNEDSQLPLFVEYDGNASRLNPSNRLKILVDRECRHFSSLGDSGDPLYEAPLDEQRLARQAR